MRIQVVINEGVLAVQVGDKSISLDPKRQYNSDFTFVSHAHTDHLALRRKKNNYSRKILASQATAVLANSRGHDLETPVDTPAEYNLVDTGHILGSRGFLIPDEFFYTGDISIRERAFLKGIRPPKAKNLVLESTFARPEYVFPSLEECIHETNELISKMYNRGIPLILMGYPLGKAQLLTEFFRHWDPLIVHESVHEMNSIYGRLGIPLKEGITVSQARKRGIFRRGVPWIMISPFMSKGAELIRNMKSCCSAVTVGFTGWATRARFRQVMGLDYAIPISDHCDFNELLDIVRYCNPEKVYTIHGFADYFATTLRTMGYEAKALLRIDSRRREGEGMKQIKKIPVSKNQSLIDSFFG
ncbi:MAG: MBL fold metallo-hydrolase RNA specificity domain-containing protein [Nitrososphaeraceae archaeon]